MSCTRTLWTSILGVCMLAINPPDGASQTPPAVFAVAYDASVPQIARPAIQASIDTWAKYISSPIPINVSVLWSPLSSAALTLGGPAGKITINDFHLQPIPQTAYPEALAKALTNHDFYPSVPEISVLINSTIDWYYGTDGATGGKYDLRTAVLRELATGLGLASSFQVTSTTAFWGAFSSTYPWVHDRFVANASGSVLVDIHPNNSAALRNALMIADLFFKGQYARAANGGVSPKLSRLASWAVLGSPHYLDEATYPAGTANALLTPIIAPGEVIHQPGPIAVAMLRDIGWQVTRRAARHADYDGDNASDITVFRPSDGTWYFRYSSGGTGGVQWGNGSDIPVPGDYDGDGRTDVAVFRPSIGVWFVVNSGTGNATGYQWGNGSDRPVPGDYDGDGRTDYAVFRPATGTWYVVNSSTGAAWGYQWGNSNDRVVPADYDGDGRTDIAVFRPSSGIWFIVNSSTGAASGLQWGNGDDIVAPADFDGDGRADLAVFRASQGTWFIRFASGLISGYTWGLDGDLPMPGDYDGDRKADLAIFRPGTGEWLIKFSGLPTSLTQAWGNSADLPLVKRP